MMAMGSGAIAERIAAGGSTVLILGEMGIGNTGSATLLMHGLTGRSLDLCVGRGTGLDDAGVTRKLTILNAAHARAPGAKNAVTLLSEFGGYEIAMLVGAVLGAWARRLNVPYPALLALAGTVTFAQRAAQDSQPPQPPQNQEQGREHL